MPNATLYDFGILTSSVHMAWADTVGGKLKKDYSYSVELIYNNFPWTTVSKAQQEAIEKTAQAILDARANHPTMTLAQMYKNLERLTDLREAHQANDAAVLRAYGLPANADKRSIMEHLNELYKQCTQTN